MTANGCEPAEPKGATPTPEEWLAANRREIPANCFSYHRVISGSGATTYRRVQRCPADGRMCTIEEQGNREFLKDPYAYFAGFSENYVLLYLRDPAQVGSAVAHAFGAGQPLAAGYHLFSARPYTWEEEQENLICAGYATLEALHAFNAAHGTSYTNSEELYDAVLYEEPVEEDILLEGVEYFDSVSLGEPRRTALGRELQKSETREKIKLGCALTYSRFERIESAQGEDVSVRIGRPSQPPEI